MIDATSIIDYTHDQFVTGIESIVSQIKQSGFEPDLIVGVVRGGAVPAVHLSHKLKTPVQMVHWSTRDANGCESNCWIPEDIQKGCNILLVDDIVDGGDTIRELLADWQNSIAEPLKRENIRIAAMWYNVSQDVTVDFYHKVIDREQDSRWICFSWEG